MHLEATEWALGNSHVQDNCHAMTAGNWSQIQDCLRLLNSPIPSLLSRLMCVVPGMSVCVCECICVCVCVCVLVAQSCPTLWDPMDCSLTGSSVHGILQARILEWTTMPFSRGSSQARDWTWVTYVAGRFFTIWLNTGISTSPLNVLLGCRKAEIIL